MFDDAEDSTSERPALQKDADRLRHALSAIRTRINELAPVSKLPPEILEEVFTFCVSWLEAECKIEDSITLTKVCRRWRYIAYNTTELWTRVDISNRFYAHESLKHSGIAPIHIISSHCRRLCTTDFQLPIERVKSIQVHLIWRDLINLIEFLGPLAHFSHLESLKLGSDSDFKLEITLPSRLKQLSLDTISIPWNTCLGLSELTHLSLYRLQYGPSLTELLMILEGSPRLEYITLIGVKPAIDIFNPPSMRTIVLPSLRELIIDSESRVTLALLSRIVQQINAHPNISIGPPASNPNSVVPPNPIANLEAICFRTLQLKVSASRLIGSAVNVVPTKTAITTPSIDKTTESIINLEFCWPTAGFILYIPPFFDLSHVTALEMGITSRHITDYAILLNRLPNLETLQLHSTGFPVVNILSILAETGLDLGSRFDLDISMMTLCPRLRHISLDACTDQDWQEYHSPLIVLAKARCEAASCIPLQTLYFKLPNPMPPELYEELRKLVPEVIVEVIVDTLPLEN